VQREFGCDRPASDWVGACCEEAAEQFCSFSHAYQAEAAGAACWVGVLAGAVVGYSDVDRVARCADVDVDSGDAGGVFS
jgi:hypothetical protein